MQRIGKKRFSTNVLVVGKTARPPEIEMMKRMVLNLGKMGLSIVYLGSHEYDEMKFWAEEANLRKVEVVHLSKYLNRIESSLLQRATSYLELYHYGENCRVVAEYVLGARR